MLWNEPEMHLKNKQVVDHVTKVTDQKFVMFSGATSTSVILLGNYIRLKWQLGSS